MLFTGSLIEEEEYHPKQSLKNDYGIPDKMMEHLKASKRLMDKMVENDRRKLESSTIPKPKIREYVKFTDLDMEVL